MCAKEAHALLARDGLRVELQQEALAELRGHVQRRRQALARAEQHAAAALPRRRDVGDLRARASGRGFLAVCGPT
jgi:hypothetical protein